MEDGTGFFQVVGGYDVLVCFNGRPVTGAFVVAASDEELVRNIEARLGRLKGRWLRQTPAERASNLKIAAKTARQQGWPQKTGRR